MTASVIVEALNLRRRMVVLSGGTTLQITNLLDEFGDDTECEHCAVVVVAGSGDLWLTLRLSDFEAGAAA